MKHMLYVVMDGIKDAEKIAGYAEEAKILGDEPSVVAWFTAHAQSRLAMTERDWHDVHEHIKGKKHDEEMLDALVCHVDRSLKDLRMRVEKL